MVAISMCVVPLALHISVIARAPSVRVCWKAFREEQNSRVGNGSPETHCPHKLCNGSESHYVIWYASSAHAGHGDAWSSLLLVAC